MGKNREGKISEKGGNGSQEGEGKVYKPAKVKSN